MRTSVSAACVCTRIAHQSPIANNRTQSTNSNRTTEPDQERAEIFFIDHHPVPQHHHQSDQRQHPRGLQPAAMLPPKKFQILVREVRFGPAGGSKPTHDDGSKSAPARSIRLPRPRSVSNYPQRCLSGCWWPGRWFPSSILPGKPSHGQPSLFGVNRSITRMVRYRISAFAGSNSFKGIVVFNGRADTNGRLDEDAVTRGAAWGTAPDPGRRIVRW